MVHPCFKSIVLAMIGVMMGSHGWAQEMQRVAFPRSADTLELVGYFSKPTTDPPYPAVVMLHGCSGLGSAGGISSTYRAWVRHLNGLGIAALLVDSLGSRALGSSCGPVAHRKKMYFERPGDAYSGLKYLQSLPDIRADRVGLMGWSQGGGIALLTIVSQSVGRPVPAPAVDFAGAVAFYPSACSHRLQSEPYTTVARGTWTAVAPVLVLHGGKDNWTPAAPCQRFIESVRSRGEPVAIHVYRDAAHSFDAPHLALRRRSWPRLKDGTFPLLGTHPEARRDAMVRVSNFWQKHLLKPSGD